MDNQQSPITTFRNPALDVHRDSAARINANTDRGLAMRRILTDILTYGVLDNISTNVNAHILVQMGYIKAHVSLNDEVIYRATAALADLQPLLKLDDFVTPIYRPGDYVTLCDIEFDSDEYDHVYRVQYVKGDQVRVTTRDHYRQLPPEANGLTPVKVLDVDIELSELNHATYKQYRLKVRSC